MYLIIPWRVICLLFEMPMGYTYQPLYNKNVIVRPLNDPRSIIKISNRSCICVRNDILEYQLSTPKMYT